MKKLLIVSSIALTILAAILMNAKSQTPSVVNSVKISSLYLYPTASPSSTFSLIDDPSRLTAIFGTPTSSTTKFEEFYNSNVQRVEYRGLKFSYLDDEILNLHIKSPVVSMALVGSKGFKVGDKISNLDSIFPDSYALRKDESIYISITAPDGSPTDGFINIFYGSDNTITDIIIR